MWSVLGALVIFLLLAALVLGMLSKEDRRRTLAGPVAIGVWFVYLVHADTVFTSAYLDVGRIPVAKDLAFAIGGSVIAIGFCLFAWATRSLARNGEFEGFRAHRLVVEGPYRYMRQPQNTGWALMLLGIALAGRSFVSLALVAVFAVFVVFLERAEQRVLHAAFGVAYDGWADRTPVLPFGRGRARAVT